MEEVRELAGEAARRLDLDPVLTEKRPALSSAVKEQLAEEIAGSDTYIGVFDRRRGTVPKTKANKDPRAITEWEYLQARKRKLRCFVFLSRADSERDPELKDFLDAEVTDFEKGVWARPYSTPDDLAREITAALAAARPRLRLTLTADEAKLDLGKVKPAWTGRKVFRAETSLDLSGSAQEILRRFLSGQVSRAGITDDGLRYLGAALFEAAFPDALGDAFREVLDLAEGRLVVLEVKAKDAEIRRLPWELLTPPGAEPPVSTGALEVVRRLKREKSPEVPGEHLSVLGFTPSPLEDQVGGARIGPGGLGYEDLFWEEEQERLLIALDPLVAAGRGRLVLPDDGARETLRRELERSDRPRILHLSCHGGAADGRPALFLEDDDGHRSPLAAGELQRWVKAKPGATPIDLAVLSACYTASTTPGSAPGSGTRALAGAPAGTEVASFAEALAEGGLAAVLGMQTSVSDQGATAFAGAFYAELAEGGDLPLALRRGRSALAAKGGAHEWAIPVLLAAGDTGPLVAPREAQTAPEERLVTGRDAVFDIGGQEYLGEGYAGRRNFERRLARAMALETRPVAIHGLGGIGKSTLAARFLLRRQAAGARVWVVAVEEPLPAAVLLETVLRELEVTRPAGLAEEAAEKALDESLRARLREEPSFLLLDNFEVQQEEDGAFTEEAVGDVLVRLKKLGGPGFGLLITSRLEVPGAANLDLAELSPSAARKLKMKRPGLRELDDAQWAAVMEHLGGHPKALEILAGYLRDHPERVSTLVKRFEEARRQVETELAREWQERGRKLLVGEVLAAVPGERLPTFERLCLLLAPLPSDELVELLEAEGIPDPAGDLGWLRTRGLLARAVAPSALEGGELVHRLLADRRQEALAEREGDEAPHAWHRRLAEHLEKRPGPLSDLGLAAHHLDAAGERAGALRLFDRWAMSLRDGHAYRASEQVAREGLERYQPGKEEEEKVAAAEVWISVHDGLVPLGELPEAEECLDRADELLQASTTDAATFALASGAMRRGRLLVGRGETPAALEAFEIARSGFEKVEEERDQAIVTGDLARLKAQSGEIEEALRLHQERMEIFERLGDVRSRAVTLGDVARLKARSGEIGEALRLHQEMLGIFERLGDVRERAVTLGDLAQLKAQAGETSEARALQEERLRVNRKLGDLDGIAAAQFDLAQLDLGEKKVQAATPRLAEAWALFSKIGRIDFIAHVGAVWGQVLAAGGQTAEALEVLGKAEAACRRLGWTQQADKLAGLIAQLRQGPESRD